MRIIATINEVTTRNWKVNAGEYKVKKCTVETPQEFAECDAIMVSFSSKENGKFVSWVKNGKCDIPCFANPGNVTVGVFAYTETDGNLELRYSPTPVVMPINMGSYIEGEKPPTPTPGTYAELLEQIANLEKGTIKTFTEKVNLWELETGIYYLNGGFNYTKTLMCEGGHILIVYKIPHTESTVKYLHLCGGNSDGKSPIRWGYTDGTSNSEKYSILDSTDITDFIVKGMTLSNKLTTAQAVMDYVDKVIENLGVGENGQDGFSPIAKVEQTDNGATITITDKDGTTNVTVLNGKDGIDGKDGKDGVDGKNGQDGQDGVSATHSWNGTVLTVTSASGTSSADLKGDKGDKGVQGIQGIQGIQGEKGDKGDKGDAFTYEDFTAEQLTLLKGSKGDKGDKGDTGSKGADGYTPVKGTDYFTEADKTEIANSIKPDFVAKNQGSVNVGKILVVGTDGNLILANMPEGGTSGDVIGTLDESNNILLSGNLADGTYTLKYENEDGTYTDVGTLEVGAIPDTPEEPTETNYFDVSTATLNARIGSSGSTSTYNGMVTTDYIPVDSSMYGKKFYVEGITPVLSTTYSYYARICFYTPDNKTSLADTTAISYKTWDELTLMPWDTDITTDTAFIRLSIVIKDNVAITENDVANLKITLR